MLPEDNRETPTDFQEKTVCNIGMSYQIKWTFPRVNFGEKTLDK